MDCTRLLGTAGRCWCRIGCGVPGIAITMAVATSVLAQPVAFGPAEVSRLQQLTSFSSDWTSTGNFDLEEPVQLDITIEGVLVPQEGNAELLFSTLQESAGPLLLNYGPEHVYHATLQLAEEVRRLGLGRGKLKTGWRARLSGWPATEHNLSPSVLLVDEIEMLRGNKRYALHDYPRMRRHKERLKSHPHKDQ